MKRRLNASRPTRTRSRVGNGFINTGKSLSMSLLLKKKNCRNLYVYRFTETSGESIFRFRYLRHEKTGKIITITGWFFLKKKKRKKTSRKHGTDASVSVEINFENSSNTLERDRERLGPDAFVHYSPFVLASLFANIRDGIICFSSISLSSSQLEPVKTNNTAVSSIFTNTVAARKNDQWTTALINS